MLDSKAFVSEYLDVLNSQSKTPALVARYVSDEHLCKHISETEAAFPNYEIVSDEILAEANKVTVRGRFRGVHRGVFARIAPTGRTATAGLIIIYEVADGKIAHHWMQFDLSTLMQQLM
jgi:predicted ester cyclase